MAASGAFAARAFVAARLDRDDDDARACDALRQGKARPARPAPNDEDLLQRSLQRGSMLLLLPPVAPPWRAGRRPRRGSWAAAPEQRTREVRIRSLRVPEGSAWVRVGCVVVQGRRPPGKKRSPFNPVCGKLELGKVAISTSFQFSTQLTSNWLGGRVLITNGGRERQGQSTRSRKPRARQQGNRLPLAKSADALRPPRPSPSRHHHADRLEHEDGARHLRPQGGCHEECRLLHEEGCREQQERRVEQEGAFCFAIRRCGSRSAPPPRVAMRLTPHAVR